MKAGDGQPGWKLVFVLLRLWMMCAMSLFSVFVWASIPRPKGADCRMNDLHPQTSWFLELYQSGDSCGLMEAEAGP